MWQNQSTQSGYRESVKSLEADIQHANSLAATLPRYSSGDCIQMRLSYSPLAPIFLYLIEWLDYNCMDALPSYLGLLHILVYKVYGDGMPIMSSEERKATLREFYTVIYPSLRQLENDYIELEDYNQRSRCTSLVSRERLEEERKLCNRNLDGEDECGICMDSCSKMVLPSCGHSMCISCFRDWNERSESCPFCRGSLKRVSSKDLWVLTSYTDIIDMVTLARDNLRRFYLYIEHLPLIVSETTPVFICDYMI